MWTTFIEFGTKLGLTLFPTDEVLLTSPLMRTQRFSAFQERR